jgi:predicted dienelactone hydrolase
MNRFVVLVILVTTVLRASCGESDGAYLPAHSIQEISTVEYTWHDAIRNREVPVKIYYPSSSAGPLPVVIFSHGLGGSREGYEYFGRYLAGSGYVLVHVQHLGSDSSVWKGKPLSELKRAMQDSVRNPENVLNRPRDVSFAIDQTFAANARDGSPLSHRLDQNRVAVGGHSFGAWTALAIAGETLAGKSVADPRVKTTIAMSPPVTLPQRLQGSAFSTITTPVLYLTGTQDKGAVFDMTAAARRIPFDNTRRAPAFLIVFNGADHMTFARHLRPSATANDDRFHGLIAKASVAFLDAYLRDDPAAKQWMLDNGINELLGDSASIEKKP